VKETILECGQTTSVSMPSALLVEAAIGAGLLVKRAGTVNERRAVPLCNAGGACSEFLEGATGEDMVGAHAGISSLTGRATCRSSSTSGTVFALRVALCVLAVESL
jgi:hypothetical protein